MCDTQEQELLTGAEYANAGSGGLRYLQEERVSDWTCISSLYFGEPYQTVFPPSPFQPPSLFALPVYLVVLLMLVGLGSRRVVLPGTYALQI
jgi:hypothetical protein